MAEVQSLFVANEKLSQEVLGPGADQIDQSRRFPRENIAALGKAGVLGLLVPVQFGGAGASLGEMSRVLDTQSQACASTAMVTLMHYCATAVIAAKGGDRLKQELLPSFARAGHLSTLAFSESGSGGHFYAPVSEVRQKRLSASKSFVTSAGEADSYVVSARKTGAAGPTESNLYLISKGASGLAAQGRFEGLGLAGNASAPMTLTDVSIDDETRLGPEGSGFQSMLEVVLPHFQIGVASVSVGIATAAFQTIVARVGARKYEHAGELNSARAYLAETIRKTLAGDPAAMLDVLAVKVKAADACLNVVSRAMTLGGGWAFGRRGGLERNFRDAQAAAVMAPSSDVLKDFMGKACLGLPLF
jgi:alkylation response protein AidB-like acyl-CoA dehydrogenase